MDEIIYDIQDVIIPNGGVVHVKVDGIKSVKGHDFSVPLNICVPFIIVEKGDSLMLSAKWMDKRHLDILKFLDVLVLLLI